MELGQGAGTVLITNLNGSGSTFTAGGNGNGGSMNSFTGSITICDSNNGVASAGSFRFNNGGGTSAINVGNPLMSLNLGQSSVHFTEKVAATTVSFGALYGGPNTQLAQNVNYIVGGLSVANDVFSGASVISGSTFTKNGTGSGKLTPTVQAGGNTLTLPDASAATPMAVQPP
jgi:hypothetical protein